MNRAGFLKSIAGGVAAAVGIKPTKAWSVPDLTGQFPTDLPCRPMVLADVVKAKKILTEQQDWPDDHWLNKARDEYIEMLRKELPRKR